MSAASSNLPNIADELLYIDAEPSVKGESLYSGAGPSGFAECIAIPAVLLAGPGSVSPSITSPLPLNNPFQSASWLAGDNIPSEAAVQKSRMSPVDITCSEMFRRSPKDRYNRQRSPTEELDI